MSDKLRRAGLIRAKQVEAPKPPEPARRAITLAPPPMKEEIVKPATKTIDLSADYELKVTPNGDRFKVEICPKSGNELTIVSPNTSVVVEGGILEIEKGQSGLLYVSRAGTLDILKLNANAEVNATIAKIEELDAGKSREKVFSKSEVEGKAIVLESGERLVYCGQSGEYVEENQVMLIFNKEGRLERTLEADATQWIETIGSHKVWYDPTEPTYLITVGHVLELTKTIEVTGTEIQITPTDRAFGARKGVMKVQYVTGIISVTIEVDEDGNLVDSCNRAAQKAGVELERDDSIVRVVGIKGSPPTSKTASSETWGTKKDLDFQILKSDLTGWIIVWNKINQTTTLAKPNILDRVNPIILTDDAATEIKKVGGRRVFTVGGENYELKVQPNAVSLTKIQAPQPAPRPVAPEPKVVVSETSAPAPAPKGAERAEPGARTHVMKAVSGDERWSMGPEEGGAPVTRTGEPRATSKRARREVPQRTEVGDTEEPRKGGWGKVWAILGVAALGALSTYYGIQRGTKPQAPTQQEVPVVAPPPVIAPPNATVAPPMGIPPMAEPADSGVITVRDAAVDAPPRRRRSSRSNGSGFGGFEGM